MYATNENVNAPLLVKAHVVITHAFEIASAIMAIPLGTMASLYWASTIKKSGINPKTVGEVSADTFVASSTGVLYWVPPGTPKKPETTAILTAEEHHQRDDAFLADNCVKMARVTVDQIKVPMEHMFWTLGTDSPAMQQLDAQIVAALESVLDVMKNNKTAEDTVILATVPVITFTESRDNPFVGIITICSRCGYWKPVIVVN